MFNLFGKQKESERNSNPPVDEKIYGPITFPIWRNRTKDGRTRFVFGISRPYERRGDLCYGKTFEVQNIKDIMFGLRKVGVSLLERDDLSLKDRHNLIQIISVLERVLSSPEVKSGQVANGHGEPNSR